jgi:phage gp16-like protein
VTINQIKLVHVAKRQLGLDEADYRQILLDVAGVGSSKDLTPRGFEDLMAHFEHRGFRRPSGAEGPADYWRMKKFQRGIKADARQVHLISQLAAGTNYRLGGLCMRFSQGRTERPAELTAKEASQLIEMLKSAGARKPQTATVTEDHAEQFLPF